MHVRIKGSDEEERNFGEIASLIRRSKLPPAVKERAIEIFRRLCAAEAAVHGMPIERVHFHEVGALDSIADIAGSAIGLDLLGVERFTSRSVPTGSGMVQCAHGLMPVPAPATARLLQGVPHLVELNIGHSIVSRAVMVGLANAAKEMLQLMETYRG